MRVAQALRDLVQRWRPATVDRAADLEAFLDRNAALVMQKCVIGYCHVKTRLPIAELLKEAQFVEAFEAARKEAFSAILADLVIVAEGYLRPAAAGQLAALVQGLVDVHARVQARHPDMMPRDGWAGESALLRSRLAEAQTTLPRPIADVSQEAARRVFDSLPIHRKLREPDRPAVYANVQFLMVGLAHEFERFDAEAIAAELLAARVAG